MTDISEQDEREAREWLKRRANGDEPAWADHARTILALLDRPRMPRPEDVPDEALYAFTDVWDNHTTEREPARLAYRALYDHYNPPPAPKKVEAWAVVLADGRVIACADKEHAEWAARDTPPHRIVHLVEADQ